MLTLLVAKPGSSFADALTSSYTTSSSSSGSTSTSAVVAVPAVQLVQVDVSQLQVVVAAPTSGSGSPSVPLPPPIDLSKVVDNTPPLLSLLGSAYVEVPEQSPYTDLGASAYDNVDGNSILTRMRVQLCIRPTVLGPAGSPSPVSVDPTANFSVTCSATVAFVDTSKATANSSRADGGQVYVITYTAKDTAGNFAIPLRRYVTVVPRCNQPERWCAELSVCSVRGLCSSALAKLVDSGTSSSSSSTVSSGSSSSKVAQAPYVPPVDRTAPRLKMLGSGMAGITATGGWLRLCYCPMQASMHSRQWCGVCGMHYSSL